MIKSPHTILVITHIIPYPATAGNEIRILNLLKYLKKMKFKIIVIFRAKQINDNAKNLLKELIDHIYILDSVSSHFFFQPDKKDTIVQRIYQNTSFSFLRRINNKLRLRHRLCLTEAAPQSQDAKSQFCPPHLINLTCQVFKKHSPDVVIAEYAFMTPCFSCLPENVFKIVDTHDVFSRKESKVLTHGIEDPFACTPQEERDYLLKADLVIGIQPEETQLLKELIPERDVITTMIDFDVQLEIDNTYVVPNTLLVTGSDNPLNLHGLNEFLRNAWPMIRLQNPDAVLRVVGNIGKNVTIEDDHVQILGWVDDLVQEYNKAAVVINPTIAGTGLKIKSVEALCKGKPLVAMPNGVDGIEYTNNPPFVVAGTWEEFARATLRLLDSKEERLRLQRLALEYANEHFSTEKVYAELSAKLSEHLMRQETKVAH